MRQRALWSFGRAYKGGKMLLPSGWRRPDSLEASTYHYTHTLAAHPITHSVRQINTSETHTGKKSLCSSSVALESLLFICLLNASSSDLTHKVILLQLLQTGAQRFQQCLRPGREFCLRLPCCFLSRNVAFFRHNGNIKPR